ncbi:MAG: efflux RND transporter periplasmic adaptor subunit [Planctomycetota bacterium]|nr:efflux RND transporter periplasmic adaptor subunit [Planctomycetota bacterium]
MPVFRSARAVAAFAFVSVLTTACSVETGSASETQNGPKKREKTKVRVALVEQREMTKTLSTTTVVESEQEIRLFPRASGLVMELKCEEGDRVAAGAVLAVLDRRATKALVEEAKIAVRAAEDDVRKADIQKAESEARIASAQMKLDQTTRDFERNDKAGLVSAQALDNLRVVRDTAKNDLEAQRLATQRADVEAKASRTNQEKTKLGLERSELDDSFMSITAPFAGVIATRSIKVGDSVGPAAAAFVLTDSQNLRAVFHRPQRELGTFLTAGKAKSDGAVSTQQPLEIRVFAEALPDVVFRGDLQLVSPSIDPASGSFRVTVRLGEATSGSKDARLLPGMLVRLEVVTERHPNALVLPKRALRREGEQNLVFVIEDGKARRIEIDEGFSDDANVEVRPRLQGALVAGAKVIVVGNRELEEGAEVVEEIPISPPSDSAPAKVDSKDAGAQKQG